MHEHDPKGSRPRMQQSPVSLANAKTSNGIGWELFFSKAAGRTGRISARPRLILAPLVLPDHQRILQGSRSLVWSG